jgi:hypothetical protein
VVDEQKAATNTVRSMVYAIAGMICNADDNKRAGRLSAADPLCVFVQACSATFRDSAIVVIAFGPVGSISGLSIPQTQRVAMCQSDFA